MEVFEVEKLVKTKWSVFTPFWLLFKIFLRVKMNKISPKILKMKMYEC